MQVTSDWHDRVSEHRPPRRAMRILGSCVLAVMFLALCGRILDFPVNRDENLFVTASVMGGFGNLYDQLGYNHLPYLPWLLGSVYRLTGTTHYLLAGRLVIILAWAAMLLALMLIARQRNAGLPAFFTSAVLMMGNVVLLGQPGMLVSNNLLPVPFALFAFYAALKGVAEEQPSPLWCFVAGLLVSATVGLKANYICLAPVLAAATVLAPAGRDFATRLLRQTLPLAVGGTLGGLPILLLMVRQPGPFFAHTVRYFTQMQPAYWSHATDPKVVTMAQKVLLAEGAWISGTSLLALASLAALLTIPAARTHWRDARDNVREWPVLALACLVVCGIVVAFVPTPSFTQYFVPPIPFLIAALLVLRGAIRPSDGWAANAVLCAMAVVGMVCAAPRLMPGLLQLVQPARWDSLTVHRDMHALARQAGFKGGEPVVTITPVLALEGGFTVPPQFAAGQFVYRVADYLPPSDRAWYTTTSPTDLGRFLDAHGSPAILISGTEPLEQPFIQYARDHGYREFSIGNTPDQPRLFRRP